MGRPTHCHYEAHVAEALLERLGALAGHTSNFFHEELLEDVRPSVRAEDEANPSFQRAVLICIAEGQHDKQ